MTGAARIRQQNRAITPIVTYLAFRFGKVVSVEFPVSNSDVKLDVDGVVHGVVSVLGVDDDGMFVSVVCLVAVFAVDVEGLPHTSLNCATSSLSQLEIKVFTTLSHHIPT